MKYLVLILFSFLCFCRNKTETFNTKPVSNELTEVSGITASKLHSGFFYVHNDSGDSARFFAVNDTGALQAVYHFKGDSSIFYGVRDCEDIAVGAGPDSAKTYVYLGDIGDNNAIRNYIAVFRFEEPGNIQGDDQLTAKKIFYRYPNGARDAETLMIDNRQRLLYIITKRETDVEVYTASIDSTPSGITTLQFRTSIHMPGFGRLNRVVAGDISFDGSKILLKTYEKIFYWQRVNDEPVWQTLKRKPAELPYQLEGIGEAVCFSSDNTAYYTIPEGINPVMTRYLFPR